MTKKQTVKASFHIAILFLLALSALTGYLWFGLIGIFFEIVLWVYAANSL